MTKAPELKRRRHWERHLAAQFKAAAKRSFSWGTFDCALFACDSIAIQTGIDPGASYRNRYKTRAEAEVILGAGKDALAQTAEKITKQFGMKEVGVHHARRGDLVFLNNGTPQGALAIIDFTGIFALCPGSNGLMQVKRHRWRRAWRV
jgi:hypothetical protein